MGISPSGQIALVAGGSRGVGRGAALGLGEAGATVYVTGRTETPEQASEGLPGTIRETAAEIGRLGGTGIPVRVDHANETEVVRLFQRIVREQGRLDILVAAVWSGYEGMMENGAYTWEEPFWLQPLWRWDAMFTGSLRAAYLTARLAAERMTRQGNGLIVLVSSLAAARPDGNAAYQAVKAATDRLAAGAAKDLAPHGVSIVSLHPGLVRTERVLRAVSFGAPLNLDLSESPLLFGRLVAALAADPLLPERSGQVLTTARLAREYGIRDEDGKQPPDWE